MSVLHSFFAFFAFVAVVAALPLPVARVASMPHPRVGLVARRAGI
jgi:hypothetical protein